MTTENNANQIDVTSESIEPPSWIPSLVAFSRAVLAHLGLSGWELSILLTDDDRIRELNRDYRGRDEVTD
ncbi:MAG: rRNA maturation RNAse YbeY, partial [Spirochaetales bacterium]|nr:rRNA maturation RNAse YbeY [Spirochaetales bacterium]